MTTNVYYAIALVAIVAALLCCLLMKRGDHDIISSARGEINQIAKALESYRSLNNGQLPPTLEALDGNEIFYSRMGKRRKNWIQTDYRYLNKEIVVDGRPIIAVRKLPDESEALLHYVIVRNTESNGLDVIAWSAEEFQRLSDLINNKMNSELK